MNIQIFCSICQQLIATVTLGELAVNVYVSCDHQPRIEEPTAPVVEEVIP